MLSIILPCYNERDNLKALFERLDVVSKTDYEIEIILVNNGSTDGSETVFNEELQKRNSSKFRVLNVKDNIGYGFGILSGLRNAVGDVLAVTHADRQTDPMDVIKAYEIYLRQANTTNLLIKGFRKNREPIEALFSFGMGILASIVLRIRLTEINAQPKVFSRSFFNDIESEAPHDFSLDLYFLYQAKKKGRIIDFPVFFAPRIAGESKGGSGSTMKVKWKLIKRSFHYIFELRKKLENN